MVVLTTFKHFIFNLSKAGTCNDKQVLCSIHVLTMANTDLSNAQRIVLILVSQLTPEGESHK